MRSFHASESVVKTKECEKSHTMLLSILIPTLTERRAQFLALKGRLERQAADHNLGKRVEILAEEDNREQSIGMKRNLLIQRATGRFVVFVDDDDDVHDSYVPLICHAIESHPDLDCIGLKGTILFRGRHQRQFVHSLQYSDYATIAGVYCRPPYHLNPIRREIAARYRFADTSYSEDIDWSLRMRNDRALTREHLINESLYCYRSRRFWSYQWLLDRTERVRHLLGLRMVNRLRPWRRRQSLPGRKKQVSDVCVCMLVVGDSNYYRAARQSIRSVLERSDFDVCVGTDDPDRIRPVSDRVRRLHLPAPKDPHRAQPFLMKFQSLLACLEQVQAEWIVLLDTDAIFADTITTGTVRQALDGYSLGMAEQTTIRGSHMTRKEFLDHYINYSLAWLQPDAPTPTLDAYRFFNAGVVLGQRTELHRLATWAVEKANRATRPHQLGEHMIADQDYFQLWANTLHPGCCKTLPWSWNHCALWDSGFPRPGAHIMHFSNFCRGPRLAQTLQMAYYRHFYSKSAPAAGPSNGTAGS